MQITLNKISKIAAADEKMAYIFKTPYHLLFFGSLTSFFAHKYSLECFIL